MQPAFETLVSCVVACLALTGLCEATTLTTSHSIAMAAYMKWQNELTGTPADISIAAGPGSDNRSAGFSMNAGTLPLTVVITNPEQAENYDLSVSGNEETSLLLQAQNVSDSAQPLALTLPNGAALTIPGSVTYFGIVSSTPIVWASIVSYNGEPAMRATSLGEHSSGLATAGVDIIMRAINNRVARLKHDVAYLTEHYI